MKFPIAIITHDAGAANHLFSWLERIEEKGEVFICAQGPSKIIFESQYKMLNRTLEYCVENASTIITGTGWASNVEHDARVLTNKYQKDSISLVDHWANYSARFVRNGVTQLPNEIWVVDEYALELAQKEFSEINVELINSHYLENQVKAIKALGLGNDLAPISILFLMEPVRDDWNKLYDSPELESFHYFMSNLSLITNQAYPNIIIKPHPSDNEGKYNHLLGDYSDYAITINTTQTLPYLLASVEIVAGCQTYAMVVALAAAKKVICVLPDYAPACALPHADIVKLSSLENEVLLG